MKWIKIFNKNNSKYPNFSKNKLLELKILKNLYNKQKIQNKKNQKNKNFKMIIKKEQQK